MSRGAEHWEDVKGLMERESLPMGGHVSYWLRKSPRRLLHSMAYYKFAAKLVGPGKRVLDVGCAEGLGTWLMARECGFAHGLDLDADAIAVAAANWPDPPARFECRDFLEADLAGFDAVVSFDVIEHILPANAGAFLAKVAGSLAHDGVAVVGTPSLEGQQYASEVARAGHVNCYAGPRLAEEMGRHFHHVFLFGGNDEVVHTGFPAMCHYLIAVGCRPRAGA